ncbi:hypothetical protein GCM10027594_19730 [Hymenobacter agri]
MTSFLFLAALLTGAASETPTPPGTGVPPVLTVKAARALPAGSTATVRAVVINGTEMGNLRYIQDADAGLALYSQPGKLPGFAELHAGDSIQVTGQLKLYNGLIEMDPIVSFHKLGSGARVRAVQVPAERATEAYVEANEGRLLEIRGVKHLTTLTGGPAMSFNGNTNYLIDGLPGTLVRITSSSTGPEGLVDSAPPTDGTFDVRGIMSQHAPGGTGGYQLMPRLASDMVRGGGLPRLTEEPVPVNVTANGFTVVFSTLNPGDTRVRYGLDPKQLKESQVDPTLTTRHSIPLANLIPGTTYYVEVSSRNAVGTETAPPVPFITSGGKRLRLSGKN